MRLTTKNGQLYYRNYEKLRYAGLLVARMLFRLEEGCMI